MFIPKYKVGVLQFRVLEQGGYVYGPECPCATRKCGKKSALALCFLFDLLVGFSGMMEAGDCCRLCLTLGSRHSALVGGGSGGSCPGIRDRRLSSILTHSDLMSSKSGSGDRSSFWTMGMGENRGSSSESVAPGSGMEVLLVLARLLTLRILLLQSLDLRLRLLGPGQESTFDSSSGSEWHSDEEDSVSINSFDLGMILLGPRCFFLSGTVVLVVVMVVGTVVGTVVGVGAGVGAAVVRGSFLGAVLPPGALPLGLTGSKGGGSFSFGVVPEFPGLGQLCSSLLEDRSTFLGCFLPVLLLDGARSTVTGAFTLVPLPSGAFWLVLGLAFSRTGLSSALSLGSACAKAVLGLPLVQLWLSAAWPSSGWEILSPWFSGCVLVRVLLWGFTLFSHLSSCHLFVDGGSGCGKIQKKSYQYQ